MVHAKAAHEHREDVLDLGQLAILLGQHVHGAARGRDGVDGWGERIPNGAEGAGVRGAAGLKSAHLWKMLETIFFSSSEFRSSEAICIASDSHSFLLKLKTMTGS